jgi:nitrogen fixation/metabolism regulation signal transduction histidine kinase
MTKSNIKHLKEFVNDASIELSQQKKIESLTKACELFNQESERLEKSYASLKEQFKDLNIEFETALNQLKQKLHELDAITYYLNSILSNVSQGILFIDLAGCVTTYNEAAQVILQKINEKILFNSFWENFSDDSFGFSMREALALQKPSGTTYATFDLPNGSKKELEIETSFVLKPTNQEGSPFDNMQGIIVLIRDITEIRILQMVANRNDRLKELGEMAAMVAHEIRNPLGGIKGFASLLLRDLKDSPEMAQMAKYIVEGTDSLNRLVTTILNYARPVQPKIDYVDLISLAQELLSLIKADSNFGLKIHCRLKTSYKHLMVPLDVHLMKSALLNLTVNSMQAMPDGGELVIEIDSREGFSVIKVVDTGVGIAPENIEKLHTPFFTTRPSGNGFGLAEVLKIVQAHGGTIEVKSEVNKGTEFTIKIPERIKG